MLKEYYDILKKLDYIVKSNQNEKTEKGNNENNYK